MTYFVTGTGFLSGATIGSLIWLLISWLAVQSGLFIVGDNLRAVGLIIYSTALGLACARAAYEEWR